MKDQDEIRATLRDVVMAMDANARERDHLNMAIGKLATRYYELAAIKVDLLHQLE